VRRLARGQIGFDLGEPASLGRVHDALRLDADERLDRVAVRASDADGLGAQLDGHAARAGLEPQLGGAQTAEARDRVAHAVDGELRPSAGPRGSWSPSSATRR